MNILRRRVFLDKFNLAYLIKRKISFLELTDFLQLQSETQSRLESKFLSAEFLTRIREDPDFLNVVKILNGNLLNLGEHLHLKKSIRMMAAEQFNLHLEELSNFVDNQNKLEVSESKSKSKIDISLIIENAEKILENIGKNSQAERLEILKVLFSKSSNMNELKWLVRIFEVCFLKKGNLRIGLGQKTLINILSEETFSQFHESLENKIFGFSVQNHEIKFGIPIKCQLSKALLDWKEVEQHLKQKRDSSEFILERKFDGERTQIHYNRNTNQIFSFSRNNETQIKNSIESLIIDGEIIGFDYETNQELSFHTLQNRIQKENVNLAKVIVFDILYLNGTSFLDQELFKRKEILQETLKQISHRIEIIPFEKLDPVKESFPFSLQKIEENLKNLIANGYEGAILKLFNGASSVYRPDNRSSWAKLKRGILGMYDDTLDLVVIGAYKGKGKRKDCFGAYLMASLNERNGKLESICKIGTGFTDEDLASLHNLLSPFVSSQKNPCVVASTRLKPDFWINSEIVFEVGFESISASPLYETAKDLNEEGIGLSLRFPKYVKLREDKSREQSSTSHHVHCFHSDFFSI